MDVHHAAFAITTSLVPSKSIFFNIYDYFIFKALTTTIPWFSFFISPFNVLLLSQIIFCFVCTCNKTIQCEINIFYFFCSLGTLDSCIIIKQMHNRVAHFCDEMMFFSQVPFIQMHIMIKISLDLLIGTWIKINNFIMKRTKWLFIDKNSFASSNELLK